MYHAGSTVLARHDAAQTQCLRADLLPVVKQCVYRNVGVGFVYTRDSRCVGCLMVCVK